MSDQQQRQPRSAATFLPATDTLALFLDVDGTLLEFASRPDAVLIDSELIDLLEKLCDRLDGALALISGRAIATLDEFFHPHRFSCAGLHGAEFRYPDGRRVSCRNDAEGLSVLHREGRALMARHPALILEEKTIGVALHYRQAPDLAAVVQQAAQRLLATAGPGYRLQPGDQVIEIRQDQGDKGSALCGFMAVPPFRGRIPTMVGDDLTDEAAFAAAQAFDGTGVIVGPRRPTVADFALAGPAATRSWLERLLTRS